MNAPLQPLLDQFVRACLDVFGEDRVEGVIVHGSVVKGGAIPGFSDVDFMVFLGPVSFAEDGWLCDDDVFAFQERIGPLPWRETGFMVPQAYFHDARRMPDWWTGPAPGSYRVLWGDFPTDLLPTDERMKQASRRFLRETLPDYIRRDLGGYVDSGDVGLHRRVRLLGTSVTPTIFALLAQEAEDALAIWALSKFDALAQLEERHPDEEGPTLARRFYSNVAGLYGEDRFNATLARETFRLGVRFLRWAEAVGRAPAS